MIITQQGSIQPFFNGGAVIILPTGTHLACTNDTKITLVRVRDGHVTCILAGDTATVTAFCASHLLLFSCSMSLQLRWWELNDILKDDAEIKVFTSCARSIKTRDGPVLCMNVDTSGRFLATGSSHNTVRVYDVRGGFNTHHFRVHTGAAVLVVEFHTSQPIVFSASDDGVVKVWDLDSHAALATLRNHASAVVGLALSLDGRWLVSGGRDKVLSVWNVSGWGLEKTVPVFETLESVRVVEWGESKRGGPFVITAGEKGILRLWNLASLKCEVEQPAEDYLTPFTGLMCVCCVTIARSYTLA